MTLVMHRPTPSTSNYESGHPDNSTSLPPWESTYPAQVPYLDRLSPALSNVEREALPSLWATRAKALPALPSADNSSTIHGKSGTKSSFDNEPPSNSWGVKTPLTAPPPPTQSNYAPIHIPPAPKSEPHPPTFVARPPPTPPDSTFGTSESSHSSPRSQQQDVVAPLPGTMSAGNEHIRRHRTAHSVSDSSTKRSMIRRWRSAFKELFTHHPVDESQFERIHDRHWAEDEY